MTIVTVFLLSEFLVCCWWHNSVLFYLKLRSSKFSLITPVRKMLHWLPVEHHSVFKTALLLSSSYKVVILNSLNLFLNLDIVCTLQVEVKLVVCCWRSHTLPYQFVDVISILVSALHNYDPPKMWNDLPDNVRSATSLYLFRKLKIYFTKVYLPYFLLCPGLSLWH